MPIHGVAIIQLVTDYSATYLASATAWDSTLVMFNLCKEIFRGYVDVNHPSGPKKSISASSEACHDNTSRLRYSICLHNLIMMMPP